MNITTPQGEMPLNVVSYSILPDKTRQEIATPMGTMISVNNGTEAWMQQGSQIMSLPDEQFKEATKEQFRNSFTTFKTFDNPGYKVIFVGADKLNGQAVNILKISTPDDVNSYKLALDAVTNLPAGRIFRADSGRTG